GSVMDTAKGVNIVVSEGGDDLMEFSGAGTVKKRLKPLIAVPTTAGTGSEVTLVAVIADHEKNRKMPFASYFLLPDVALLDSRVTSTLPPFLTAATAMDALSHAVDACLCLSKNPLSDANAMEAISLIFRNLLNVVKKPDDPDGRLALATAATLAGISFSNSMVGVVHGLGHSVGAICHAPHGVCMAIFLPYGLEYNLHKVEDSLAELLFPIAGDKVYARTPKEQRAEKAIAYIRKLNQDLYDATDGRHPRCLKELVDRDGAQMVPREKLGIIAKTSLGDGTLFYNPEDLDYDDCLMVLEAAWEGGKRDRTRIRKSG
ncbi:MAG: iron-containing alcohol dehydrogenase, partial [Desulfobacterales bacterium]|nr:iron-containing alcohol dehydrogenase [Desulfobacterales bacterium]